MMLQFPPQGVFTDET